MHLVVGATVEPAERPVADQLAHLGRARDAVGRLIEHRLALRRHRNALETGPGKVLAPVRVRVLRVDRERDLENLRPVPPVVEDRLRISVEQANPLTNLTIRDGALDSLVTDEVASLLMLPIGLAMRQVA